jgi:hypothetical protein
MSQFGDDPKISKFRGQFKGESNHMGDGPALSSFNRSNLEIQGVTGFSDEELFTHRQGFRFACKLCFAVVLLGTIFQGISIFAIAATVAFLAVVPPNHPFDYLYNVTVRRFMRKPKVLPRVTQGRFACAIATVWLSVTTYFFALGWTVARTAMGLVLLTPAGMVGFFDVRLPSMLYNAIVHRRLKPRA